MKTAKEMFEELGWKIVKNPQDLPPTFNDYYSEDDVVYAYYLDGEVRCRLYFIKSLGGNVYGYSMPERMSLEEGASHRLAIHQQMKELGWIE